MLRAGSGGCYEGPVGHQLAQPVLTRGGHRRHEVRYRSAVEGHANLLATTHRPRRLAERLLELSDTDLAHVDTLSLVRPQSSGGSQAVGY